MSPKRRSSSVDSLINPDLHVLKDSVSRIEERVTYIQETQIPAVAAAAKEARDGVLVLTEKQKVNQQRLKKLEDDCDSAKDNGQRISANERELAGLSKWRWWLMGAIVTAVIIAGGYAIGARGDLRAAEARQSATDSNVARNESSIRILEKQQQVNREAIIREVRDIPSKIPIPTVYDDISKRPLTATEEETVRRILRRSEERTSRLPDRE